MGELTVPGEEDQVTLSLALSLSFSLILSLSLFLSLSDLESDWYKKAPGRGTP